MNLAETYAAYCGCKINIPELYEEPIELPTKKYITLHSWCEKETNRRYAHWQDVVNILLVSSWFPFGIVQVGDLKDPKIYGTFDYTGKTSINQLFYVIKNSILHIGYDSFPMHIASVYDIPIVSIFRNYIEQSYPAWSSKEKVSLLMPELNEVRPPYGLQEQNTAINKIDPTSIVLLIKKHLGL